jgi:hypothetical protein
VEYPDCVITGQAVGSAGLTMGPFSESQALLLVRKWPLAELPYVPNARTASAKRLRMTGHQPKQKERGGQSLRASRNLIGGG